MIARDYDNDAASVWRDAKDGRELEKRLLSLPGIGEMKAKTLVAILGKQLGVRPPGWEDSGADAHDPRRRRFTGDAAAYQAGKRAFKAAIREAEAAGLDEGRVSARGSVPGTAAMDADRSRRRRRRSIVAARRRRISVVRSPRSPCPFRSCVLGVALAVLRERPADVGGLREAPRERRVGRIASCPRAPRAPACHRP